MAARAWIVAVMNDGADRVHVVTGCGFGGVYGTADSPHGADAKIDPAAPPWPRLARRNAGMTTLVKLSRVIVGLVGALALLASVGNLTTGGAPITDPVIPGGVILGLLLVGAWAWTDAPGPARAAVVWLGVIGLLAALVISWINTGDMQTRDLLVYIGIPTLVMGLAAVGVAIGRVRAGALGR
jgi:hypothetical protein